MVALIEGRRWSTALVMRRLCFDVGALLLIGLELALTACSVPGSAPAPTPGAASAAGWVLVQVPKDVPPDTYPPIEKTKRVQTFPTFAECDNYRTEAMWDAAATGSDVMDEDASSLRCIADKSASGKPTSK
jgi:hypothetical protein